jgi:hypothetical protein
MVGIPLKEQTKNFRQQQPMIHTFPFFPFLSHFNHFTNFWEFGPRRKCKKFTNTRDYQYPMWSGGEFRPNQQQ